MKKMNNIAIIAMALAMALAIVVPVFASTPATTNTPAITTPANPFGEIIADEEIVENVDTIVENEHICTISKANANRHIVDCECGEYEYVRHDAENMDISAKNEFFHEFECSCGYSYSETHSFATSYDPNGHQEVCVDCGYAKEKANHVFVDEYYGDYHDITCIDCGYMSAHHVGVSFTTVDNANCFAKCKQCGNSSHCAHDFYGFTCDNCEFVIDGITYAIVEDIREYDDGTYRVRFMSNGNSHRVTMNTVNFTEGDFVKINHYGDEIFEVSIMVDDGIVDAPNAFPYYIHSDLICEGNENCLDNLVLTQVTYTDDNYVWAHIGNRALGFEDYVVYNMVNGEMFDLEVGYAYLTFHAGSTVYFIAIW